MHPELFKIPFTELTVKTYGLLMVLGFLSAVWLIRRLSKDITPNPDMITNAALYSLIAGVFGARLFYVVHYRENLLNFFVIWNGGLELLGGVIFAVTVIFLYLRYHKLPARQYLDILAVALMLALAIGRIGCFFSGCCYGKPADVSWAVRFPYSSDAYRSQVEPNPKRNRAEPHLKLPDDYFGYTGEDGSFYPGLKPYDKLTEAQKILVGNGSLECLPVHPTQLYSSGIAAVNCLILFVFWKRNRKIAQEKKQKKLLSQPGSVFALMFLLYGTVRFFIEFFRDDNPFEYAWWAVYKGGTISQNISIYLFISGWILLIALQKVKPKQIAKRKGR